ncbi:MAG: MATE family efflux transporter [Dorea sp.]|nr:MATE family efflux transporter [Dorea sp.]
MKTNQETVDLTKGSAARGIIGFTIPLILGQLLQQLYNMADAWVIGNFADNTAFAAVSTSGSLVFLIVGLFNGIAIGGGVVISRYFGAGDERNVERAVHTNILFGIAASVVVTIVGVFGAPQILMLMQVPENVLPESITYFQIYFAGSVTIVMYNMFMSIMRALGDSLHPLYYLAVSSIANVLLDILFVAGFHWGVAGAAIATVLSQGMSAVLCILRMRKNEGCARISLRKLKYYGYMMKDVIYQGLPAGIQNSVISIGNVVVQMNVNSFGEYAMSGMGSHSKVEGFVFIPIMAMSLTMSTFISQNLGAKEYDRAKKGAAFGIISCVVIAEVIGLIAFNFSPYFVRIFAKADEAVKYGVIMQKTVTLFYFLLAFSHSATGVLRGCGKSVVPMVTMLGFWCGIRVLYVTTAIRFFPVFQTICWAYPITWTLSSIVFIWFLLRTDWVHAYEQKKE